MNLCKFGVPYNSFRFDLFRFVLFRFVSICFVSFRSVSFRFDLFRFVSICFVSFRFVSVSFRTLQGPLMDLLVVECRAWVPIPLETYIFILNFSFPSRSEQLSGANANEIKDDHSHVVILVLDFRYDSSRWALYTYSHRIALMCGAIRARMDDPPKKIHIPTWYLRL